MPSPFPFRPSLWSSRSRRSNTDRSRSRSWRSVGRKARMFAWSRPSRSSACPTRAQATRDARSTCRSSARSSRASPTWSKSTCFAAAFTRRLSRERWPRPKRGRSITTCRSIGSTDPKDFFVYPISLQNRLPVIPIPLLPGDPDTTLDLQAVLDQAYDFGPYLKEVAYGEDPIIPPLTAEQAEWAAVRLKQRL